MFLHKHNIVVRCDKCNGAMKKLISSRVVAHVFPADGIFLEHVEPEGRRFHSKSEMVTYAREHSMELGALL